MGLKGVASRSLSSCCLRISASLASLCLRPPSYKSLALRAGRRAAMAVICNRSGRHKCTHFMLLCRCTHGEHLCPTRLANRALMSKPWLYVNHARASKPWLANRAPLKQISSDASMPGTAGTSAQVASLAPSSTRMPGLPPTNSHLHVRTNARAYTHTHMKALHALSKHGSVHASALAARPAAEMLPHPGWL